MPIYCTYLTIYRGNKLPPFYIGSTNIEKINKGYHGSIRSKKYRTVWETELKQHPELFKTKIITKHYIRQDAMDKEYKFQKQLNVVKSKMYINQAMAAPNGFFGMDAKGKDCPAYGRKRPDLSERNKIVKKNHTIETKQKISINKKGKYKGKIWITNTFEDKMIFLTEGIPEGWIKGRTNCIFKNKEKQSEFIQKANIKNKGLKRSEECKERMKKAKYKSLNSSIPARSSSSK